MTSKIFKLMMPKKRFSLILRDHKVTIIDDFNSNVGQDSVALKRMNASHAVGNSKLKIHFKLKPRTNGSSEKKFKVDRFQSHEANVN